MSYWNRRGYRRGGGRCRGTGWDRGVWGGRWGRGNPYSYYRWNPNLPRNWWRNSPEMIQQWGIDASQFPYTPVTGFESMGYPSKPFEIPENPIMTLNQQKQVLEADMPYLEAELESLRKRMAELKVDLKKGVK